MCNIRVTVKAIRKRDFYSFEHIIKKQERLTTYVFNSES